MSMLDDMKGKMGDMDKGAMMDRMHKLEDMAKNNQLDDKGKQELSELRAKFANH